MRIKSICILLIVLLFAGCSNVENTPDSTTSTISPTPTLAPGLCPYTVMVEGTLYYLSKEEGVLLDEENLIGTVKKCVSTMTFPQNDMECNIFGEGTPIYRDTENNELIYLKYHDEKKDTYSIYKGVPPLAKVDGELYWISYAEEAEVLDIVSNQENLIGTIENKMNIWDMPENEKESNELEIGTEIYRVPEKEKVLYFVKSYKTNKYYYIGEIK